MCKGRVINFDTLGQVKGREGHIKQELLHVPKEMFWASFSAVGLGRVQPIDRIMNCTKHESLLKSHLLRTLNNFCPQGDDIFQQDKATRHNSKQMQKFFQAKRVKLLE